MSDDDKFVALTDWDLQELIRKSKKERPHAWFERWLIKFELVGRAGRGTWRAAWAQRTQQIEPARPPIDRTASEERKTASGPEPTRDVNGDGGNARAKRLARLRSIQDEIEREGLERPPKMRDRSRDGGFER